MKQTETASETKTCVIYARVSSVTDRQDTARQVCDLTRYADACGYTLVHAPFEEHISGAKKSNERPLLSECLQYCEANHVDTLLVSELSRLGRSTFDVLETVKRLTDAGINIYFQKEKMQTLNADGTISAVTPVIIACLGMCAQLERENIKYRLNSGRALYIEKGGKLGRKAGSIESTEQTLAKYPEVVRRLKKGYSVRDTAHDCDCSPATVQKVRKLLNL